MTIFKRYPANTKGRDFIVGDIHGCLDDLYLELNNIQFDSTNDRLFSVGDLIDRGPQSLHMLKSLSNMPWFIPVLGNHETMFINAVTDSNPHPKRTMLDLGMSGYKHALHYLREGGDWSQNFTVENLTPYVNYLKTLPSVIQVDTPNGKPFLVAHASLHDVSNEFMDKYPKYTVDEIKNWTSCPRSVQWSRDLIKKTKKYYCDVHTIQVDEQPVNLCAIPLVDIPAYDNSQPLIYVGHSCIDTILLLDNTVYIDTGSFFKYCDVQFPQSYNNKQGKISIIEHKALLDALTAT